MCFYKKMQLLWFKYWDAYEEFVILPYDKNVIYYMIKCIICILYMLDLKLIKSWIYPSLTSYTSTTHFQQQSKGDSAPKSYELVLAVPSSLLQLQRNRDDTAYTWVSEQCRPMWVHLYSESVRAEGFLPTLYMLWGKGWLFKMFDFLHG